MGRYWVFLIFVASVSHAVWNLMLKRSEHRIIFLWGQRLWSVLIFLSFAVFLHSSAEMNWIWVLWGLGSAILHSLYSLALVRTYKLNDFVQAYPIARGTGPLIVMAVGGTVLGEKIRFIQFLGALSIIIGIQFMYAQKGPLVKGPLVGKHLLKALTHSPWPILVGACTAGYTLFDKLAVSSIPPLLLNIMENMGQVIILGAIVYKNQKTESLLEFKTNWAKMALAGFLVGLAYLLVLIVLTEIPVSFVSPIRESSILFASIFGCIFLKERAHPKKLMGAGLIFLGIVLIL